MISKNVSGAVLVGHAGTPPTTVEWGVGMEPVVKATCQIVRIAPMIAQIGARRDQNTSIAQAGWVVAR